jgi:transcription elongation GreA/GreB family factor
MENQNQQDLRDVNERIHKIEEKLNEYKVISAALASKVVPSVNPVCPESQEDYYEALKGLHRCKFVLSGLYELRAKQNAPQQETRTQYAIELEERRVIKEAIVNSATHERWRNRMSKQVEGFVSRRIH